MMGGYDRAWRYLETPGPSIIEIIAWGLLPLLFVLLVVWCVASLPGRIAFRIWVLLRKVSKENAQESVCYREEPM
jgi:hypothetical protein